MTHRMGFWSFPMSLHLKESKTYYRKIRIYVRNRRGVGRDSAVGIANRYGLDGPEIESRWGRDFPHLSRKALGPTQLPIHWVPGFFPRVKRPGRGVDHPPPSSAEVKKKKEKRYTSTPPLGIRGLF
jgi:hypothetical protein